mmetsp:Transcript_114379/g.323986  ORF Transcript_114379/g.323986 Transcript_114379/m.323986 type:complete len:340 (-) Transcript_114379:258-1277(-)
MSQSDLFVVRAEYSNQHDADALQCLCRPVNAELPPPGDLLEPANRDKARDQNRPDRVERVPDGEPQRADALHHEGEPERPEAAAEEGGAYHSMPHRLPPQARDARVQHVDARRGEPDAHALREDHGRQGVVRVRVAVEGRGHTLDAGEAASHDRERHPERHRPRGGRRRWAAFPGLAVLARRFQAALGAVAAAAVVVAALVHPEGEDGRAGGDQEAPIHRPHDVLVAVPVGMRRRLLLGIAMDGGRGLGAAGRRVAALLRLWLPLDEQHDGEGGEDQPAAGVAEVQAASEGGLQARHAEGAVSPDDVADDQVHEVVQREAQPDPQELDDRQHQKVGQGP